MALSYTSCWNWKQQAGKPGILPNHPPQHFRVLSWLKLECEWCNTWPNVWYGYQVDTIWQWNTIQFLDLHTCPSDAMDLSRARLAQLSGSPANGSKNMRNIIWEMIRNATFEQQSLPRMNNPYQSITKPSCAWKVTGAEWEPFANDLTNLYQRIWCDIICDDLTCTVPCHDATWTVYRFSSFWCTIQRTDQA